MNCVFHLLHSSMCYVSEHITGNSYTLTVHCHVTNVVCMTLNCAVVLRAGARQIFGLHASNNQGEICR